MLGRDLVNEFEPASQVFGFPRTELDITDREGCARTIEAIRPDVVINAAAMTNVDLCESSFEEAWTVNGEAPGFLAEAAARTGTLLVHFSTDYVFDGLTTKPYVEEDLPNPRTAYGRSKLHGENQIRKLCPRHLILRTSWVFGCHGRNFIRTIVTAAQKGGPLRVVSDQIGSPTYTRDLASYTRRLVEAGKTGLYHLTNSGSCSWHELASRALHWAGLGQVPVIPVTTAEFPRPAPRPAYSVLANARLCREGFPLPRPWHEAAEEYVTTTFLQFP